MSRDTRERHEIALRRFVSAAMLGAEGCAFAHPLASRVLGLRLASARAEVIDGSSSSKGVEGAAVVSWLQGRGYAGDKESAVKLCAALVRDGRMQKLGKKGGGERFSESLLYDLVAPAVPAPPVEPADSAVERASSSSRVAADNGLSTSRAD